MDYAFEYYKKEFAKHSDLAEVHITKAYYAKSPFARKISLVWADRETVLAWKALIKSNEAIGNFEDNAFWQKKIDKVLAKYPTERQVLLYEP